MKRNSQLKPENFSHPAYGAKIFKFFVMYIFPLIIICILFPIRNPVYLKREYSQSASYSGSTILSRFGFVEIPKAIPVPTDYKPPIISLISVPKDLFEYRLCYEYFNYFIVNNRRMFTGATALDVRVKIEDETYHLKPNEKLCNSFGHEAEIFVGDAKIEGDKLSTLLDANNRKKIDGKNIVVITAKPINDKIFLFTIITFVFYPFYWGAIIAWKNAHKSLYDSVKIK